MENVGPSSKLGSRGRQMDGGGESLRTARRRSGTIREAGELFLVFVPIGILSHDWESASGGEAPLARSYR